MERSLSLKESIELLKTDKRKSATYSTRNVKHEKT